MKRCPTCKRAFDDETLSFCLEDGTPLVTETASRSDSQETLVSPRGLGDASAGVDPGLARTQSYNQLPGKATISASPYSQAQPYGPATRQRKTWPWIVGIGAILLVIVIAIVVVAFTVPGLLRASENGNRPGPTPRPDSSVTPTPSASPTSFSDVPTDSAVVLSQLSKVEMEWTEANIKGDKEALERILADEYVGNDDKSRTKRKYIDSLTPDESVNDWELSDLTVDQTGERAVVHGTLKEETDEGTETYNFVDTFVWRDHRWQAVASTATRVK
jgi:hypothetical protein